LVQEYAARFPVRHYDLYRLAEPSELDELGFDEAASDGLVLVEWPERAETRLPADAIHIGLAEEGPGRTAAISGPPEALARIARSLAIRDFLAQAGWAEADRAYLQGDASARAYESVAVAGEPPRVLMN